MTTPHPTPEERYEAAVNALKLREWHMEAGPRLRENMIAAIREAEAAGEARGRAAPQRALSALLSAVKIIFDELDIEPADTTINVRAVSPDGSRSLATITFDKILRDAEEAARTNKDSSDVS